MVRALAQAWGGIAATAAAAATGATLAPTARPAACSGVAKVGEGATGAGCPPISIAAATVAAP